MRYRLRRYPSERHTEVESVRVRRRWIWLGRRDRFQTKLVSAATPVERRWRALAYQERRRQPR